MDIRTLIVGALTFGIFLFLGLSLRPWSHEPATHPMSSAPAVATEGGKIDQLQQQVASPVASPREALQISRGVVVKPSVSMAMGFEDVPSPSETLIDVSDTEYRWIGEILDVDDHIPLGGEPVAYGEYLDADDPDIWMWERPGDEILDLGGAIDADATWYPEEGQMPSLSIGQPIDADSGRDL